MRTRTAICSYKLGHVILAMGFASIRGKFAYGDSDGRLEIRNIPNNVSLSHSSPNLPFYPSGILCLAWSPTGETIVTARHDNSVQVTDVSTGTLIARYDGHKETVHRVFFSPDGGKVFSVSIDGTIRSWEFPPTTGSETAEQCLRTFEGHGVCRTSCFTQESFIRANFILFRERFWMLPFHLTGGG